MPPLNDTSPGLSINDVQCSIYLGAKGDQGGIIEHWTDSGLEVRIEFLVKWNDRISFIQALRGVAGVDENGYITRTDPWSLPVTIRDLCPDVPPYGQTPYFWDSYLCVGTDPFRPIKAMVDQDGSETGIPGWVYYDSVIIPARFMVTPYQVGPFNNKYNYGDDLSAYPYTSIKGKATGEAFQAWYSTYVYAFTVDPAVPNSGQPVGDTTTIRPKQEFTITRYMMPFVATEEYDKLIGKVNSDSLWVGTTHYAPESILYMGYEPEWISDPSTGLLFYNIHHTVVANGVVRDVDDNPSSSWNMALTKNGRWSRIVQKAHTDVGIYPSAEFIPAIWPETQS